MWAEEETRIGFHSLTYFEADFWNIKWRSERGIALVQRNCPFVPEAWRPLRGLVLTSSSSGPICAVIFHHHIYLCVLFLFLPFLLGNDKMKKSNPLPNNFQAWTKIKSQQCYHGSYKLICIREEFINWSKRLDKCEEYETCEKSENYSRKIILYVREGQCTRRILETWVWEMWNDNLSAGEELKFEGYMKVIPDPQSFWKWNSNIIAYISFIRVTEFNVQLYIFTASEDPSKQWWWLK